MFAGETIGALVVETHADQRLSAPERRLLAGIARQVAAAGHAVSLTDDLLRSRERQVAATEEERRRLRRDLHDGLGPDLAGVVLGLHRARRQLDESPEVARAQLDVLAEQMQRAVRQVARRGSGRRRRPRPGGGAGAPGAPLTTAGPPPCYSRRPATGWRTAP